MTCREILYKFAKNFAHPPVKEENYGWWGHDTDLGDCNECFDQALAELEKLDLTESEMEMILSNYIVYGSPVNERAQLAQAILSAQRRKRGENNGNM